MTDSPAQPLDARQTNGLLAAAVRVVSGLTLLSRFAGLARDVVTAHIFADSALGSAFRAAYAVPNLFRRLFGEGALSAAFIPEYTRLRRENPEKAHQLATLVVRFLTLATGAITLLIELVLLAGLFINRDRPETALSIKLMMLMLPMMPMVCLTAILGGMLQVHGRFAPPAAAPIILNLFQIAAGAFFLFGLVKDATLAAYLVGAAAVVASVAQILWSVRALRGKAEWLRATEAVRESAKAVRERFIPATLGLGTLQLNTFLDMLIAMWPVWVGPMMFGRPVPLDDRSNAILSYTQTLYQFPLGVFGIAVATAVFPLLSRVASDSAAFDDTLRRGLRLSLFIGLPASVGLFVTRHDLVAVVFQGGKGGFSEDGLARAADVLAGFSTAVWAYSLNHVLTRAFYARGDTKTPMRVAMLAVLVNVSLNLTLIWSLREAGLAWATAASSLFQFVLLLTFAKTKLHTNPIDRATLAAFARIALASAAMGVLVYLVVHAMPSNTTWRWHALRLAAATITGIATYATFALLIRAKELRWLFERAPKGADGKPAEMSFD